MAENIKVIIRERRAQVDGGPVIVCGNSDYTITFDFDSDWNLTGPKTARFVYVKGGEVLHEDKVFSGKTVAVPVLSDVSFVDVGVFAGDLCTTTPARIRCKRSILCGSGEVHEPTPDVYAQIMALFNEMAEQGAFGATEAQAQQIEANKQNIAKMTNGTTPAGKATDANKLGGETALQWQGKIDSIQTTSRATLNSDSWYRVAEYNGIDLPMIKGSCGNSCVLFIKGVGGTYNDEYKIQLNSINNGGQKFSILSSKGNVQHITKVRYVYEPSTLKAYLEVYCVANRMYMFGIGEVIDAYSAWKTIDAVATSETVSGVTVTTTYDIPANASPVTDLDLKQINGKRELSTSILEKALEVGIGVHEFSLSGSSYTGGDLPEANYAYGNATIRKRGSYAIAVILWGVTNIDSNRIAKNEYNGTSWSGWKTYATTADLEGYFKKTGGRINGNVVVEATDALFRYHAVQNTKRGVYQSIDANGTYTLTDETNNKKIIISALDGTTTFNGTASGNLPLDGGGTVTASNVAPLNVNNTSDNKSTLIGFDNKGVKQGYLGFSGVDNPVVYSSTIGTKSLLHTGNSEKVAIQSTAPTDGLWVW